MLSRHLCLVLVLASSAAAQSDWNQLMPASSPTSRTAHALAYDEMRNRIVLFGGTSGGAGSATNDTWEFDGATWTQMAPANSPPARVGHIMAYDPVSQRVVLFGGLSSSVRTLSDTWVWDGMDWTQLFPANSPTGRLSHSMCYDLSNGRVMLFGGNPLGGSWFTDTWYWDNAAGDWVQLFPTNSPSPTIAAGMCWDPSTAGVLLYGGYNINPGETWLFTAGNWTQLAPTNSPGYRYDMVLTPDMYRNRVVMFGGATASQSPYGPMNDVWEWDGVDWQQVMTTAAPSPRFDYDAVWDPAGDRHVLFGGGDSTGTNDETWQYVMTNPATSGTYGMACAGSNGSPSISGIGLPWAGETYQWVMSGLPTSGPSAIWIGGVSTNIDLSILGAAGCSMLVDPFLAEGVTVAGGQAVLSVPIGASTGLVGATIYAQVFNIDVAANTFGVTSSNGASATLGRK